MGGGAATLLTTEINAGCWLLDQRSDSKSRFSVVPNSKWWRISTVLTRPVQLNVAGLAERCRAG